MNYRIDLLKKFREKMYRIEKTNPTFNKNPKWNHYKELENSIYEQINLEK